MNVARGLLIVIVEAKSLMLLSSLWDAPIVVVVAVLVAVAAAHIRSCPALRWCS